MFDDIPRNIFDTKHCSRALPRMPEDIAQNSREYSPAFFKTFPRVFQNITRNVCRHSLELETFFKIAVNMNAALHKTWSFPLRISSVNVTKSTVNCRFVLIFSKLKISFFVQCRETFLWPFHKSAMELFCENSYRPKAMNYPWKMFEWVLNTPLIQHSQRPLDSDPHFLFHFRITHLVRT